MGTSSLKSTVITNRDATPRVASNANLAGAILRSALGSATAVAADDTASRYRVIRLPSNCFVRAVYVGSVAQGGSGAVNVGIYRSTQDGASVVSATLFASAFSVVSAVNRTDVTNQSTNYTSAKKNQPLWQAAGLTADPGGELDVVIAPSAALTNGGAIDCEVQYVV